MNLYCTADAIGLESGGGKVTHHESLALRELGPCEVWGRKELIGFAEEDFRNNRANKHGEPWCWDETGQKHTAWFVPGAIKEAPELAHFYAGSFSSTVENLKARGTKVTYTAAAHNISLSRREHEKLGLPFDYPHLTEPELWKRYVGGYLAADVVICPSQHSKRCMESYGCRNVAVIPHGVDLPKCRTCQGKQPGDAAFLSLPSCPDCKGVGVAPVAPPPQRFTVGYLGAVGPDKGLWYLLQAWARLDGLLILAGRDCRSDCQFIRSMLAACGLKWEEDRGNVRLMGWVENVSDFYNAISLYVQPSVTEGFGIEVLEALAHGRPVLCSDGAGAVDAVPGDFRFEACDVGSLATGIDRVRNFAGGRLAETGKAARASSEKYTWDKIKARYQQVWKELLGCR